jgi:hypothetical protein
LDNTAQPQSWKKKVPTPSKPNTPTNDFDKKAMEESISEELSRKFEIVSLANMNRRTQKGKEMYRFFWCDSLEHQKRNCAELRKAIRRNVVYLDGFMICSNKTRKPLRVRLGRGGMKKIVEEEDVQHVDAMHYVATPGIRVGRENVKPIETRVGFWPTVFKCEKKGRIDLKDLKLVG